MKNTWAFLIVVTAAATFIPGSAEANSSDFSGGVAIGTGYAGIVTAPTNGLVVQGNVGVGTTSPRGASALDVNGVLNANSLTLNRLQMPMVPGGRVTLSSSSPVMTADVSDVGTIYYLPYTGQNIPVYDGANWGEQDIGSSGLSLTLSATNMPTTEVFDLYASMQSGSVTLCSLYWGSNTARSSTAGGKSGSQDARVVQQNGIWVNKTAVAASNCYNNLTAYTLSAGQGSLLGTFYTDANGAVSWACNPAAASTGSNNILGIGNVYNQVPFNCTESNSTTSYTLVVTTPAGVWRQQDNSANTRVTDVDPLGYGGISASSANVTENVTALTNYCNIGMCFNSTSCTPTTKAGHVATSTTNSFATDVAIGTFYSALDLTMFRPWSRTGRPTQRVRLIR